MWRKEKWFVFIDSVIMIHNINRFFEFFHMNQSSYLFLCLIRQRIRQRKSEQLVTFSVSASMITVIPKR